MSAYMWKKYSAFFDFMDRDGDGFLTKEDFITNVVDVKKIGGFKEDGYIKYQEDMLSWWVPYAKYAEKNGGKVDKQYAVQTDIECVRNGNYSVDIMKQHYGVVFNYIDRDKDGRICPEEFLVYYKAHNWTDENHIREIFRRLDVNQDGFISKKEFVNAGLGFWLNDDPECGFEFLYQAAANK